MSSQTPLKPSTSKLTGASKSRLPPPSTAVRQLQGTPSRQNADSKTTKTSGVGFSPARNEAQSAVKKTTISTDTPTKKDHQRETTKFAGSNIMTPLASGSRLKGARNLVKPATDAKPAAKNAPGKIDTGSSRPSASGSTGPAHTLATKLIVKAEQTPVRLNQAAPSTSQMRSNDPGNTTSTFVYEAVDVEPKSTLADATFSLKPVVAPLPVDQLPNVGNSVVMGGSQIPEDILQDIALLVKGSEISDRRVKDLEKGGEISDRRIKDLEEELKTAEEEVRVLSAQNEALDSENKALCVENRKHKGTIVDLQSKLKSADEKTKAAMDLLIKEVEDEDEEMYREIAEYQKLHMPSAVKVGIAQRLHNDAKSVTALLGMKNENIKKLQKELDQAKLDKERNVLSEARLRMELFKKSCKDVADAKSAMKPLPFQKPQ